MSFQTLTPPTSAQTAKATSPTREARKICKNSTVRCGHRTLRSGLMREQIRRARCPHRAAKSAETIMGAPLGELSRPCVVTEGFDESLMKIILTPPFRSAQHLPCKGGKKNLRKFHGAMWSSHPTIRPDDRTNS